MAADLLSDDFVAGLVIGAGCTATAFVGTSEQEFNLAVYNIRQGILSGFANLGPDLASAIGDAFIDAVRKCRSEIETATTGALQ